MNNVTMKYANKLIKEYKEDDDYLLAFYKSEACEDSRCSMCRKLDENRSHTYFPFWLSKEDAKFFDEVEVDYEVILPSLVGHRYFGSSCFTKFKTYLKENGVDVKKIKTYS